MLGGKSVFSDYVFILPQFPETASGAVKALRLFTDCNNF